MIEKSLTIEVGGAKVCLYSPERLMKNKLNFYVLVEVVLSVEDYTNAGLSKEEVRAEIEKVSDPVTGQKLIAQPYCINSNWTTRVYDVESAWEVVERIQWRLDAKVASKGA